MTAPLMPVPPTRLPLVLGGLVGLALVQTGCGPNCYSTCSKLYQEECKLESPGQTQSELIDTCLDACNSALDTPGEVGEYNPFEKQPGDAAITLDNDRQAALWMDCVAETACEKLESGYCAPVW